MVGANEDWQRAGQEQNRVIGMGKEEVEHGT